MLTAHGARQAAHSTRPHATFSGTFSINKMTIVTNDLKQDAANGAIQARIKQRTTASVKVASCLSMRNGETLDVGPNTIVEILEQSKHRWSLVLSLKDVSRRRH
jgi:hypothetical protein